MLQQNWRFVKAISCLLVLVAITTGKDYIELFYF